MPFALNQNVLVCIAAIVFLVDIAVARQQAIAQDAGPAGSEMILQQIRSREPEQALETLGRIVDQTVTIEAIADSGLPSGAGGLYRSLAQSSVDEQYLWLEEWTMPNDDRGQLRILSVPVPTDAPPKVFARSLGERARDSSFAVASVGPVKGFFCSGWMLVTAADELGRIARLRSTIEDLSQNGVDGAQELLMLSHIAGSRGDLGRVEAYMKSCIEQPQDDSGEQSPIDMTQAAIASASLLHESLQPLAETLLAKLVDRSGSGKAIGLRPFLRIAQANAVQVHRGESKPDILFRNSLKYWVPATVQTAKTIDRGHPDAVWLTHEQHVLHLAGGVADVLFCRYPMVGDFDFICETQEGGSIGTDGGLVYGGLHFQALGRHDTLTVWDADCEHSVTRPSPFARHDNAPVFNRVSIRSTAESANFESNFHPVWFDDDVVKSSPWIGLRSVGNNRPVFRNLKIKGKPSIPRGVRLADGNQLRGWQSGFFGETQPSFDVDTPKIIDSSFDWMIKADEIIGGKHEQTAGASQGLLQYQRPLLDGESITYEFLHEGKDSVVHPAVGRLAFLLEPTGVRVRWITTGQNEWTGLEADNASLEPLNRRGSRPLPLVETQWNSVSVQMTAENLLVSVNGELVYQRPRDDSDKTTFGLYRENRSSECRVKNIVMTGDWPETLPEDFVADPVTLAGEKAPRENHQSTAR